MSVGILKKHITYKGFSYNLISQGKKALIYQQQDEEGNTLSYEVFRIKIQMAGEKMIKGKKIDFIMKIQFPNDNAFGDWAWSFREIEDAKNRFKELENKTG